MNIVETIGFDLGHGETAVAKAVVESAEPPEMLEVNHKKVQVTALGWHPNLGYLVGEQALIQAGVTQLQIAFKQKPSTSSNSTEAIRHFLAAYYRLLRDSKQVEGGENSYFYVGCPSGWSASDRAEYQKLLQEAGIPALTVIPESRAAFMQAKEAGKLEYNKLLSSVLIVDLGSSTTDFTLVKSLYEVPIDFGSNALGASLIDKAIFDRTVANHEQKELLEIVFEAYPHHKARCELACRRAKEDYFSNEQLYSGTDSAARGFESINEEIYFIPQVNRAVMEEILNQPLEDLGGKSWRQLFEESVRDAKEKLSEQGIIPKVVLMTGGASRMNFTRQVCAEIFPEPDSQVRPDPEPERCIALGLARVGRWDLRATAFKEEVNRLLGSRQLKELIEKQIPELIEMLVPSLASGLIENAVKPSLQDWKNNKIRILADLEDGMKARGEKWLKSPQMQQVINQKSVAWFNSKIQPQLAEETDPICRKFHISRSSLRFEEGIAPAAVNAELSLGDAIVGDIVGFIGNIALGGSTVVSIITLIITGHFTWPLAVLYGASVLAIGVELTRKGVKDTIRTKVDVPGWSRSSFLSDSKIESICEQMNPEIEKILREQLAENQEAFDELTAKVGQELQKALSTKVQEAIILIQ